MAEVVGQSCDISFNCRAFIWQSGVMTDLNSLTPPDSSLYLLGASDINSQGEIVGTALDLNNGEQVAFLAAPCDEGECGAASAAAEVGGSPNPNVVLPNNVRKMLRQRLGHE
jgi:probable HAF family extracellular repeat protein